MNDWIRCDSSSLASIAGAALFNFSVNGTCGRDGKLMRNYCWGRIHAWLDPLFHGWNAKEEFSMFCAKYIYQVNSESFILSALVLMFMIFLSAPRCCFLPSWRARKKWTEKDAVVLEQKNFMKNSASHNFQITEIDECCRWDFFLAQNLKVTWDHKIFSGNVGTWKFFNAKLGSDLKSSPLFSQKHRIGPGDRIQIYEYFKSFCRLENSFASISNVIEDF